ncbi:MAG: glucan biosynthesis protein [Pseudomonadota bacterium]
MRDGPKTLDRRQALLNGFVAGLVATAGFSGATISAAARSRAARAEGTQTADPEGPEAFSHDILIEMAKQAARKAFVDRRVALPERLRNLSAERYRGIRFRRETSSWPSTDTRFALDILPSGFLYRTPIQIHVVEDGLAKPLMVEGPAFTIPDPQTGQREAVALPYSGLSLSKTAPGDGPPGEDPMAYARFRGASFFQAIGNGQDFGTIARGLALKTAHPDGEEIPVFQAFWISVPEGDEASITIHALLDSPSATGAYRFMLAPGSATMIDVDATIFARQELPFAGLAPLTSMFLYDGDTASSFNDYRRAVHNCDGLAIWNGMNEWIWRPLKNPTRLQISAFADENPRGFGLIQRKRRFEDFGDGRNRFEDRPSSWVEPLGDWGRGQVQLIEIPSRHQFHDNITVFWRPVDPPGPGNPYRLNYRIHWGDDRMRPTRLSTVVSSRRGRGRDRGIVRYGVAFRRTVPFREPIRIDAWASRGRLTEVDGQIHPRDPLLYTVVLELDPEGETLSELRVALRDDGGPISEIWLDRWTG